MNCVTLDNRIVKSLIEANLIPEYLGKVSETLYVFADMDNRNRINAFIIFSEDNLNHKRMFLEYVYVKPSQRGNGISKKLMEYAVTKLKPITVNEIRCAKTMDVLKGERFERFVTSLGFEPLIINAWELRIAQGSMESEHMQMLHTFSAECKDVVRIEEYDDIALKHFWAKHETTGIMLTRNEYEPSLCRFYKRNGVIEAAICIKGLDSGDFFLVGAYKDNECTFDRAIPYMMAELVYDLDKEFDSKKDIIIKVYDEKMYEAITKTSKLIRSDKLLQEYVLKI